eukprot:gene2251-3123_t
MIWLCITRHVSTVALHGFACLDLYSFSAIGCVPFNADAYTNEDTNLVARLAAGSLVDLVESVVCGDLENGFALIRPPGHHAGPESVSGFCHINNVAVAAEAALLHPDISRVAIIDWDVHHGNGPGMSLSSAVQAIYIAFHRTQDIFYDRQDVGICQGNWIPNTYMLKNCVGTLYGTFTKGVAEQLGFRQGLGHTVNVAWQNSDTGDPEFKLCFDKVLVPLMSAYAPDLILVSAGFDAAE